MAIVHKISATPDARRCHLDLEEEMNGFATEVANACCEH